MPAPRPDHDAMVAAGQALLPRGAAWPRDPGSVLTLSMRGLLRPLSTLHQAAADLLDAEAFPPASYALLPDWEAAFGLPDGCTGPLDGLERRRAALTARITAQGGQSRAYFVALAAAMGFTVTIREFRPSRMGSMRMGERFAGVEWNFVWAIQAPSTTVRPFRMGAGTMGERFRSWGNAELECRITALKPAHTHVLFQYS